MKCVNCNDEKTVSVTVPCPDCQGRGTDELTALRNLAKWVHNNFAIRSKPPRDGVSMLDMVMTSQGNDYCRKNYRG